MGIPSGHPTIGVPDAAQPKTYLETHLEAQTKPKITRLEVQDNSCKPYLAAYIKPGRVYMSCGLRNRRWLLGLHLGLQVGLRLGRIGYANGGVPRGYAHVSSPRVSGRFAESGRDSEQLVE